MDTTRRFALIGQLGTGKSFVANRLSKILDARIISFGQEVYKVAEQALGRKIDKRRPGDRRALTDIGTHWGRNGESIAPDLEAELTKIWPHRHGYENIWVDALDRSISQAPSASSLVLDDLRFPNELNYLLDHDFRVLLVSCDVTTRSQRLQQRGDPYATTVDSHPSERLASGLTRISRTNIIVPTLWNDQRIPAQPRHDKLQMTLEQLEAALLGNREQDMLTLEENAYTWRKALETFRL